VSVVIRLTRQGRHKKPFYRIVVADKDMPRDGRFLELIGYIDNLKAEHEIKLNEDRVKYWVGVGAIPSDTVASIIEKKIPGYLSNIEKDRLAKVRSKRAARKAKAKTKPAKKSKK